MWSKGSKHIPFIGVPVLHDQKCPHPLTVVEKRFWLGPFLNPLTVVVSIARLFTIECYNGPIRKH